MMLKFKCVGVGIVLALALNAVAATASYAAEWLVEGGVVNVALAMVESTTVSPQVIKGEVIGIKVEIECSGAAKEAGSSLGPTSNSVVNMTFTGCTVLKPAGCTVKPIKFTNLDGTLQSVEKNLFTPQVGTNVLANVVIEGCLAAGNYKLQGKFECKVSNHAVAEEIHYNECAAAESKVTLGGNAATYSGSFSFWLTSHEKFDVS